MNKKEIIGLMLIAVFICGSIFGYLFHESKEQYEIRMEAINIHNEWIDSQAKVSSNITDICNSGSIEYEERK